MPQPLQSSAVGPTRQPFVTMRDPVPREVLAVAYITAAAAALQGLFMFLAPASANAAYHDKVGGRHSQPAFQCWPVPPF